MTPLLDKGALRNELDVAVADALREKKSTPAAVAAMVVTALEHVIKRVSAEMTTMKSTSSAMGEVVASLPARLQEIEHRITTLERDR